ncbi:hypothetical protein [Clostridium celatum]|uniref:Uncharacterized protein n=1 Tax=Clostridium celatum DSM 1785 TaxID=545697 RepID=L1Q9X0_9CLOT|nr:hypothetical protein [Clostridium celatum]EKY24397.1 hypothetical protein HMPREF0216_02697 [Clostridium celatum DSM 1785]MCE9655000.1 hypothetical protein [Clostridium celatum]MDU2266061.1 hypothetical protein [Clostridium celatum]MDU3724981.1 hypothetical protein [Clostridium celatum]MDU6296367.1 hypothetical protein [Clostridium celatum]
MKNKFLNIIIFILSSISLIITLKLFYNIGIYVDEYNTTPSLIYGGEFWLYMDWLRLGISILICVLSAVGICKKEKKN